MESWIFDISARWIGGIRMRCKQTGLVMALGMAFLLGTGAGSSRAAESGTIVDPFEVLTTDRVRRHVTHLADEAFGGRCTGEPGCRRAAEYIRDYFKACGLRPATEDGFFQSFTVETTGAPDPRSRFVLTARGRPFPLSVKEHFVPFGFSGEGEVEGEVVFAGYGISAPDLGYDDYEGLDVRGKIVLILRHGPGSKAKESPFAGRKGTAHTAFTAKALCAQRNGASALLLFSDPVNHPGEGDPLVGHSAGGKGIKIPCLHIKRRVAAAILACVRRTPKGVQGEIDQGMKPLRLGISDVHVKVKVFVPRVVKQTQNVAGVLEGSDAALKKEVVVVGAHYDHIGRGFFGSRSPADRGKIHPGADDNATGTAGVMLLARAFASLSYRPRRTVLFIAFAGEEMGLLGSAHYVRNPLFPLRDTVAMINMDMLGYLREERVFVLGAGTSPDFEKMIRDLNRAVNVKAVPVKGAGGSDQMSFYARKIPVLFFCTGTHPHYHTPRDTADRINFAGEAEVLKLVFLSTARLASADGRPGFVSVRRSRPGRRTDKPGGGRVRLGIIPDQSFGGKGIKVLRVMPGSSSHRAGMQNGDVIVKIGSKDIRNMADLEKALAAIKWGERVSALVLRDDVEKDLVLLFSRE
jgi:hypothetical protein